MEECGKKQVDKRWCEAQRGDRLFWDVRKYLPSDTTSHPKRKENSM